MKRLALALVFVLMATGTAMAHGRFSFGINIGIPVTPYGYAAGTYYAPAPPPPFFYYGGPVVIYEPYHRGYGADWRMRGHDYNRHGQYGQRFIPNRHNPVFVR